MLTLLFISFLLSLCWIQLQAKRGDFVDPQEVRLSLTNAEEPMLLIQAAGKSHSLPLYWLNRAAGWLQRLERWISPPELRFSLRFGRLLDDLQESARYRRLEEDFYRNAGQV